MRIIYPEQGEDSPQKEIWIEFTPRLILAYGRMNDMHGVPLKFAIIYTSSGLYHWQTIQLHIWRWRVGVLFPMKWRPYATMRWSFPKMPEVKS